METRRQVEGLNLKAGETSPSMGTREKVWCAFAGKLIALVSGSSNSDLMVFVFFMKKNTISPVKNKSKKKKKRDLRRIKDLKQSL